MQPKSGISFVRKTGMRALRMKPLADPIYKVLPVITPLVEISDQKRVREIC